jgi:AraC-like DNA-binding protein
MLKDVIADTIKSSVLNEPFSIELLQFSGIEAGQPYRPDYNNIVFVTKGKTTVLVDGATVEISKDNLLLISKGQVFCFLSTAIEGYSLKFGNCFWDKTPISASNCKAALFDSGSANMLFRLGSQNLNDIASLFLTLLNEYNSDYYSNKPDALAAYLKILVIKIANINALLQKDIAQYDTKLYQEFQRLVSRHFAKTHNVSDYANMLGVSPRKLTDACKSSGMGAKEVISSEVVAEAKRLLQFSSQSVKEIASNIGFETPYQFSSFFKKHVHLSPVEFRNRLAEIGI